MESRRLKKFNCPNSLVPHAREEHCNAVAPKHHTVIRKGYFTRKSDQRLVQRLHCKECDLNFSAQTLSLTYRQRKIWLNSRIEELITSGVSKRRCAKILGVNRETIDRKIRFLAKAAKIWQENFLRQKKKFETLQFDDLETFEHTKMKPLSVPLVVDAKTRFIIAIGTAQMPAKGLLAAKSLKKYGPRKDMRPDAWNRILAAAAVYADANCAILSDTNPHYPAFIAKHFPGSTHSTVLGGRGCIAGYGELKKKHFDPMFSLNHSCAMLRDNLACLKRRTWTTTKKPEELENLLWICMKMHNIRILEKQPHLRT